MQNYNNQAAYEVIRLFDGSFRRENVAVGVDGKFYGLGFLTKPIERKSKRGVELPRILKIETWDRKPLRMLYSIGIGNNDPYDGLVIKRAWKAGSKLSFCSK
jgi:hypothetical protein